MSAIVDDVSHDDRVIASFSYQSSTVTRSMISTGEIYLERDTSGSDSAIVGLDPISIDVPVCNGRIELTQYTLERNGFAMTKHDYSHIDYYEEDQIVTTYYDEVCQLVKSVTGAKKVFAFDHNIRSASFSSWMNSHGNEEPKRQINGGSKVQSPAVVVHNDYTITSAPTRLGLLAEPPRINDTWARTHGSNPLIDPSEIDILMRGRYAFINVWRNIADEPVQDMPLAMCDAESLAAEDLITFEIR